MTPDERKVNILLVDDRPENLLALEGILDEPDYHLVKAVSGRDALKCLLDQDFALILLDVQMPGMDGFETAQMIKQREKSRDIPIIFISAISKEDKYITEGYSTGAVDYLVKPYDPKVLKAKVAVFVDLYQKNRQLREQLERENRVLARLNSPSGTSLTAQMFGLQPLRKLDIFNDWIEAYSRLLDLSLEQRTFKVEHDIPAHLRALAEQMGFQKAGPRDVVDLHSATLKGMSGQLTPHKMEAYLEEGRLLILELMGYLVSFYRTYALGGTRSIPPAKTAEKK